MNALFLVKRLLVAGLSVVILTATAGAGAAASARMDTPGAFAPFTAAPILLLGSLALGVCCGRRA